MMFLLASELVQCESMIVSNELTDLVNLYGDTLSLPAALVTELHCWWMKWYSPGNAKATMELHQTVR